MAPSHSLSHHIDPDLARLQFLKTQFQVQGAINPLIYEAFKKVPREMFLEPHQKLLSYSDQDLLVSGGRRALLSPRKLAGLLRASLLKSGDKILLVGFASAYSIALCGEMGLEVYGVEEESLLFNFGQMAMHQYVNELYDTTNIDDFCFLEQGSLLEGLPSHAPYDVILIEGGAEAIPETLLKQLGPRGKIVYISTKNPLGMMCLDMSSHQELMGFEKAKVLPGFKEKRKFLL